MYQVRQGAWGTVVDAANFSLYLGMWSTKVSGRPIDLPRSAVSQLRGARGGLVQHARRAVFCGAGWESHTVFGRQAAPCEA